MFEFINPPELGPRPRPFSRATKAGGFVFVSGHSAPHDPANGKPRGETAQEQVRGSIETLKAILEAAGSSLERIVWVTMLIIDPADYDACNEEYIKHFPHGLPARQTVRFGVPTDAKVGFSCIALAGDAGEVVEVGAEVG